MEHESDGTERPWVRVHTVGNRFEADLLVHALEQEWVPVRLRIYEETPYDGLFVPQRGWGALFVPVEDEEKARNLIKRLMETTTREPRFQSTDEEGEQGEEGGANLHERH
jgi:hypothetical protein